MSKAVEVNKTNYDREHNKLKVTKVTYPFLGGASIAAGTQLLLKVQNIKEHLSVMWNRAIENYTYSNLDNFEKGMETVKFSAGMIFLATGVLMLVKGVEDTKSDNDIQFYLTKNDKRNR